MHAMSVQVSRRLAQRRLPAPPYEVKRAERATPVQSAFRFSRPHRRRQLGPTPLDVVAWFHTLIAVKIYRALFCSGAAARGDGSRAADSLISAKIALIGIDRSLDALTALAAGDDDPRLELLRGHLRRMKREVETRFPEARSVVREGLD